MNGIMRAKYLIQVILRYRKSYKNYLQVLFKSWRLEKEIRLKLINGNIEIMDYKKAFIVAVSNPLAPLEERLKLINKDSFYYQNRIVKMQGMKENGDIPTVFFNENYAFLRGLRETYIDIGANIGDTAIYFALNGAERVIALEPSVYAFNFGQENIVSNRLGDQILLINAGYGPDSEITVDAERVTNSGSQLVKGYGKTLPIYSLKTILSKYGVKRAVLKMDCEGCEYNLLNEDDLTLKKFSKIQIEYHYGYAKLEDKLAHCGFTVKHTLPKKGFNPEAQDPNYISGFIYAEVNNSSK